MKSAAGMAALAVSVIPHSEKNGLSADGRINPACMLRCTSSSKAWLSAR